MTKPIKVFILAAGLGERLRPITYHIPKPLLPILGKPVLQTVLERVSNLQAEKIGLNLYHKAEMIDAWIRQSEFDKKVELFHEKTVLNTGGGLKNAEAFLGGSTFLVHNSDILSDIDLEKLIETHYSSKNLVTLAVHDWPEFNHVFVDEQGVLKGVGELDDKRLKDVKRVAFTGIAVYSPEFMKYLPEGASGVVDAWLSAMSDSHKIGTLDVTGCYWSDIGTAVSYSSEVFNALRADGETVYIHPLSEGCKDIEMQGFVVIEKQCVLDKGVSLENCIVLPEGRAEADRHYENCIIGPDFKTDLGGASEKSDALLISAGGSDREYYRIKKDDASAVFVQCSDEDPDFQRQMEYTRFFLKHSVPVPELIETESDGMMAIFEDLGDISLYSWLKCPREYEQIKEIYKKVIDILILIHTAATGNVSECPLLQDRVFDYEHFRWETGYFIERYINGIRNIKVGNPSVLDKEFHKLALKADSFPKTIVHRDFQSQNIMITKGKVPRIIDYQGARMGPPAYDVVSILWDPYYRLENDIREYLLDYYISKMTDRAGMKFKENEFRESLLSCRLQRHMQALGAYGFLSAVRGKKYFLKHVPGALSLLKQDVFHSKEEYPELFNLVTGL